MVGYLDHSARWDPEQVGAALGERVLVDLMLYDGDETALAHTDYLGSERDGGFATGHRPATNVHRIESPLTDPELASS